MNFKDLIYHHSLSTSRSPYYCEYFFLAKQPCHEEFAIHFNSLWPGDAIWREIWVNTGSSNGLLPDGTKPLPEPIDWLTNVDWSSVKSSDNHLRAISQKLPQPSISKISLKITYVKFNSNLPGDNDYLSFTFRYVPMDDHIYVAGLFNSIPALPHTMPFTTLSYRPFGKFTQDLGTHRKAFITWQQPIVIDFTEMITTVQNTDARGNTWLFNDMLATFRSALDVIATLGIDGNSSWTSTARNLGCQCHPLQMFEFFYVKNTTSTLLNFGHDYTMIGLIKTIFIEVNDSLSLRCIWGVWTYRWPSGHYIEVGYVLKTVSRLLYMSCNYPSHFLRYPCVIV